MSYDPNNIFAKILKGEMPCQKIYQDEFALAFYDINRWMQVPNAS
jgi:diadenosine tetraphosphate (Ap4A) HIT family hydrolase